jgi:hypothetical protein
MKKCPNCQKEFPDSMRFCQTDGTPLVEFVEETPVEDALKTTVVRQEDIVSSIPPSDPFKTMVAGSFENNVEEEEEDVLQLPEEHDPLKTMIAPPNFGQDKPILEEVEPPKFDSIKEEIKAETPAVSLDDDFSKPIDSPFGTPELPKFEEPSSIPQPNFSEFSAKEEKKEDFDATLIQSPYDAGKLSGALSSSDSAGISEPKDSFNDSPFSKPKEDLEIPALGADVDPLAETELKPPFESSSSTPFDAPSSPFDSPATPFGQSSTPFGQSVSPFDAPKNSFDDEPPATQFQPSAFEPPKTTFQEPEKPFDGGIKFGQDQPFGNQPLQQAEWTPPPAPDSSWQNQELGQNTPFQPPPAMAGQNQTLPIISLVLGICSVCCYITLLTGPAALITGYIGMKNANENPQVYGGKGLAIAGMIVGGVLFALVLLYVLFWLLVWFGLIGASVLGNM